MQPTPHCHSVVSEIRSGDAVDQSESIREREIVIVEGVDEIVEIREQSYIGEEMQEVLCEGGVGGGRTGWTRI